MPSRKKPGSRRAFSLDMNRARLWAYFEDDFFEDDLRFFEPPLFRELDFFDDFELDLEPDFDELFLADLAIAVFLSVPFQKGHGNRVPP
jgi:hypothetical protein